MKFTARPSVAFLAAAVALTLTSAGAADAVRTTASPRTGVHTVATSQQASRTIARSPRGQLGSHIVGHTRSGRPVTGSFIPLHFAKRNGHVVVRGLINGVVHKANGKVVTFSAMRTMRVRSVDGTPVAARTAARTAATAARTCGILNLVLGPLDLNLLGLVVHLDKVVLNVTAQSGAGNLLGNLLCSVAGLLDNGLGGALGQLTNLLNQILGALRLGV